MDQSQDNSNVDLNRSLPSLPLKLCLDLPPNISFNPTSETVKLHERLTSSTSSSSKNSGTQQMQNLTCESGRPSSIESPSPTYDQSDILEPVKYNPTDKYTTMPLMLSLYVAFVFVRFFFDSTFTGKHTNQPQKPILPRCLGLESLCPQS